MRRLSPLVLVALLGLALPASAAAQEESGLAYSLANGCHLLTAASDNKYVAKNDDGSYVFTADESKAEPFRFQATRLGQFLLYGKAQDFLSGGDTAAQSASAPDGTADWRVFGNAGNHTFTLPDAGGRALGREGDKLVMVDQNKAAEFLIPLGEGCPVYPEV